MPTLPSPTAVPIRAKGIYGYIDVAKLFKKGHLVWRWHAEIGRETRRAVRIEAPFRTGALKRSIYTTEPEHRAATYLEIKVGARRRYSIFVHEGTTGPIYAKSGKWLKMSTTPLGISGYDQPLDPTVSGKFGKTKVGKRFTGATQFVKFPGAVRSPPGVAGQHANPFMARGLDIVATKHRWRAGRTRIFAGR